MPAPKTQDLPPPGGYQKIRFTRVPAKSYFSGFQIIGAYVGMFENVLLTSYFHV